MTIKGIDFSNKYVCFEVDGVNYTVQFRSSFWRGIYDVQIFIFDGKSKAKIKDTYPCFRRRIREAINLIIPSRIILFERKLMRK